MRLKKIKYLILIIILILIVNTQNNLYITSSATIGNEVNVAVLESNPQDPYIALIRKGLENIQDNSENKVKFTFYDTKMNESFESEILDTILKQKYKLILGNLVNTESDAIDNFVDKTSQKNMPVVLFNSEPLPITNKMKNYNKFIIVTTYPKEAGILQGKLIIDEWNKNKSIIDKNKDNIIQYVMLQGPLNNLGAIDRTKFSISTVNDAGIKTQELSRVTPSWNQQLAKDAVSSLLLKYSNKIEMIISNNDAMAIGAIEALQEYGYNNRNPANTIPVFGIDGIAAAQDLIKKGYMTGTVYENPIDTSEALYKIGMNLVNNKPYLEDTTYKFDETGFIVRVPYRGVITQNSPVI